MAQRKPKVRVVHGDNLLYRFFQDTLADEPELFERVPRLLLQTMGIWLPLDVYQRWPILLPWVVRDPACRGSRSKGIPDAWSAPDENGYLRDDNSMIKALPRALTVRGPAGSHLQGARMGTEFVACHVWREVHDERLASRIPLLNSFVPNLMWLPRQIAKLSDVEGGIVQQTLQGMAHQIYRQAPVAPHLRDLAEEAWSLIPEPALQPPVDLDALNWFESTDRFFRTRSQRLSEVIAALDALVAGEPIPGKVITTRYTEGLDRLDSATYAQLRAFLIRSGDAPSVISEEDRQRVEFHSTLNLQQAQSLADRGDTDARAWLIARDAWLAERPFPPPDSRR